MSAIELLEPRTMVTMTPIHTAAELAAELRCSRRKVTETAARHGIGMNLGGRAGYRFSDADKGALWNALRATAPTPARRRRIA